jgi:hypothetical protein
MMKTQTFLWVAAAVTMWACSSKDSLLTTDGGPDVAPGTGGEGTGGATGKGGSGGNGGGTMGGSGGAGTAATAGTQATGSGGMVGTGGSAGGAGGIVGTGGAGTGGTAGATSGTTIRDGGAEVARDTALDTADGLVECAPGYPVGSTKPAGDGCNTCTCRSDGSFACTTAACPGQDGSVGVCPSNYRWCPGCTPGTGTCAFVCPASPCPVLDGATAADAADGHADGAAVDGGACSSLTTLADCQARSDCHAVFTDPGTCGCASSGCCARFSRCADGGNALCTQPTGIACTTPTPFCESPYVLSYTAVCFEGCVLSSECGP